MPYIDGLPAAASVSDADLLVLDQGGTGVPGSATTVSATVAQLKAGLSFVSGTTTAHGVVVGAGTNAVTVTGAGTAGQVLTSNGASADPTFQAATGGSGSFTGSVGFTTTLQKSGTDVLGAILGPTSGTFAGENAGTWCIANPGSAAAQNTFFGTYAGWKTAAGGAENTFIGSLAGKYNVTGHQSAAIGCGAMWHETESFNVAVGSDTYRNWVAVTGTGLNTAVGFAALNTGGGAKSVAVGAQAMNGNSAIAVLSGSPTAGDVITLTFTGSFTGSPHNVVYTVPAAPTLASVATGIAAAVNADSTLGNNVSIYPTGIQIAFGLPSASVIDTSNIRFELVGTGTSGQNVVITAGVVGTTVVTMTNGFVGNSNIAVGYKALAANYGTSAAANVAIGDQAMSGNVTSASSNISIGSPSGQALTTGTNNILLGGFAGNALTTPNYAVAIGQQALALATTPPDHQIAIGRLALGKFVGTTGQQNVAIGGFSVGGNSVSNHTVQGCVGIGYQALALVQTGANFNIGVGYNAGGAITTGAQNTLVGTFAGQTMTSGAQNTLVGYQAGASSTASGCVAVGYLTGKLVTGNANTMLGGQVGSVTLTSGTGNILIGVDATTDTAATSTSNTVLIKGISGGTAVLSATGINGTPTTILGGLVGYGATTGIIAHAGGGQASALALTTTANLIATCATAADSVRLPVTTIAGLQITITNNGAASAQVYGAGTDTINGVATGTGVAIAAGKTALYTSYASGAWFGGTLT